MQEQEPQPAPSPRRRWLRRAAYRYHISPIAALSAAARDELWQLYRRHFAAARASLEASLGRAEQVVRIRRRRDGALCGMMVFSIRARQHAGRRFYVAWAGAGALERECRGRGLLERAGIEAMLRFRCRHPTAELFFIGECCSFLSYRLLARSFAEFWPHPARATPAWERGAMDAYARQAFPTLWDPVRRIVRVDRGKHILAESRRTRAASTDPLFAFFSQINPGAAEGEAFILFAPVHLANLGTLLRRKLWPPAPRAAGR